jgi:hypothetical protein
MKATSSLRRGCKTLGCALCAAVLFLYFCRPVVVIHYSAAAEEPIGYIYDTDWYLSRDGLHPGESTRYFADWRQKPGHWTGISVVGEKWDYVEINGPFSRVDVYVGPDAKVQRTEIRYGFFARFTKPKGH